MNIAAVFASFSVDDLEKAEEFYSEILGLEVKKEEMEILKVKFPEGEAMIYPKQDHKAATYTVLNLVVPNIDESVDELTEKKIVFEQYDGEYMTTDEKGIARGEAGKSPNMAWFKDPAGNILSLIEE